MSLFEMSDMRELYVNRDTLAMRTIQTTVGDVKTRTLEIQT